MIRFLQQDSKFVKGVFIVFIAAAVGAMVITLVPGIFDNVGGGGSDCERGGADYGCGWL